MQSSILRGVALFTSLIAIGPALAQAPPEPSLAPPNPAFIQYQKLAAGAAPVMTTTEGFGLGRRPSPLDLSHASGQRVITSKDKWAADSSPAYYDLRTVTNKLPPVRNQGSCGDCWTFATFGSLESWLRPTETTWDFSEMDMNCSHGFDWLPCVDGGNREMATAFLTRWDGPALETCYPHGLDCTSPRPSCAKQKLLLDVLFLPDRAGPLDNQNIKDAVTTYGAVYTTYYHDSYSANYRPAPYYSYYCGSTQPGNHAVCIVGWDDNFDRTRFVSPNPPGNGAFIVRNSWGSAWGEAGYFYISYYDANIGCENAVFINAAPTASYTRIYQYDPYGWLLTTGYGDGSDWSANIFTAAATEQITAVAFYTPDVNSSYELYVYTGCPANTPRGGTLAASQSGTIPHMGYHTLALTSPVTITSGQRFSIVLKLTTTNTIYPICMERPYSGYCSVPTASLGQSFMSTDGASWMDMHGYYENSNACLRALVGPADTTPPTVTAVQVQTFRSVDVTFSEPMGAGVTTAANYTLSGTGKGSLSASPASVALVSGNKYRLTWTAGEMKNGGNITICVSANVKDLAGNAVATPNCGTHVGGALGTPPVITTCATPRNAIANSNCQAPVPSFTGTGSGLVASDNVTPSGSLIITQLPAVGTVVGLGVTPVTITVTDQAGNSSTCPTSFTVSDPDNDGICGTLDQCPSSVPGAIVDSTGCSNGPGDFDRDGDVDQADFETHMRCLTGPALPYTGDLPLECPLQINQGFIAADMDADYDVDSEDFGFFQRCYSGEDQPSDPECEL